MKARERGVIILGVVIVLAVSAGLFLMTELARAKVAVAEREVESQKRLQIAKEAVLNFAVSRADRGYLPCPADHTKAGLPSEGDARSSCTSDAQRLGVLPWKALQSQGLFDANGDRFWYAVSQHVLDSEPFINPDQPTPNLLAIDGRAEYVAIVFSPGLPLTAQDRNDTIATCSATGDTRNRRFCSSDWLDAIVGTDNTNADRTFFTKRDGINDLMLGITADEFFSAVGRRALQQVAACLRTYAADPGHLAGTVGRLPWAAPVSDTDPDSPAFNPAPATLYSDVAATRFGRLPVDLSATPPPGASQALTGVSSWGSNCPLHCSSRPNCNKSWLKDWREHLFYGVSQRHAPDGDAGTATPVGPLLTVTLADGTVQTDAPAVVILSGKVLGTQVRTTITAKNTLANYVEGTNAIGSSTFDARQGATLNDQVLVVRVP